MLIYVILLIINLVLLIITLNYSESFTLLNIMEFIHDHRIVIIKSIIILFSFVFTISLMESYTYKSIRSATKSYRSEISYQHDVLEGGKEIDEDNSYCLKFLKRNQNLKPSKIKYKLTKLNKKYNNSSLSTEKALYPGQLLFDLKNNHFNIKKEEKVLYRSLKLDHTNVAYKENMRMKRNIHKNERKVHKMDISGTVTLSNVSISASLFVCLFLLLVILIFTSCIHIGYYNKHVYFKFDSPNKFDILSIIYKIMDEYVVPVASLTMGVMSILLANNYINVLKNSLLMLVMSCIVPFLASVEFYKVMCYELNKDTNLFN